MAQTITLALIAIGPPNDEVDACTDVCGILPIAGMEREHRTIGQLPSIALMACGVVIRLIAQARRRTGSPFAGLVADAD
jgi:hypothetical protein